VPLRLALAIAVLAAALVAGLVTITVLPRAAIGARPGSPDRGSANTFGRPAGFELTVSDVRGPDASDRVAMDVSFHNTSSTQQRAEAVDFTYRDASGTTARPVFDAACPRWNRADLHPAGGAGQPPRDADAQQVGTDFGPVPLCFLVAHPAAGGATLVWDPDIGLLGSPVTIPLR
jgi:hypothetical protein